MCFNGQHTMVFLKIRATVARLKDQVAAASASLSLSVCASQRERRALIQKMTRADTLNTNAARLERAREREREVCGVRRRL